MIKTHKKVLTFVMAGGKGERLHPLTRDRAKPAVPFGGIYRIIDFTLSNCLNSGLRKIYVLIQYKSYSLMRHLRMGWDFFDRDIGEFIDVLPAQMMVSNDWYQGTADAIYQNTYFIDKENPDLVLVLAGDHIYKMDYGKMIEYHIKKNAEVTVGAVPVSIETAHLYGIMETDEKNKIVSFCEKPNRSYVEELFHFYGSMGIYLFNRKFLEDILSEDAKTKSKHDFGKDVIPFTVSRKAKIFAYPFVDENKKEVLYWRDIGTIDAYYEANMDLVSVDPIFNLYDDEWPIHTYYHQGPPAKTVFANEPEARVGQALDSLLCPSAIISGGRVVRSIISPNVRVNSWTDISESIIMEGVEIGRGAKIRKTIIDKFSYIPSDIVIGYDEKEDKKRFFVTKEGIVVIPRLTRL
ncbi:TPA: glucose-1-phosphate adenylyltransferase [bacterium]|nr:glucose-1-phosphate adenylyltransferase [bacterium]